MQPAELKRLLERVRLTCSRTRALWGSPRMYQATCLRISRAAHSGPTLAVIMRRWRRPASSRSAAVGGASTSPRSQ